MNPPGEQPDMANIFFSIVYPPSNLYSKIRCHLQKSKKGHTTIELMLTHKPLQLFNLMFQSLHIVARYRD